MYSKQITHIVSYSHIFIILLTITEYLAQTLTNLVDIFA